MRASALRIIHLALLGLAAAMLSCGGPGSYFAGVPDDPRLGRRVATGSRLRQTLWASAWNPDAVYLAVAEAPGHSPDLVEERAPRTRIYRIDPQDGGGVGELPALGEASEVWLPTLTWPGVLVVNATGLHYSNGGGWAHLKFPPFAVEAAQVLQANARSADLMAVSNGHQVGLWRDGSWWLVELEAGLHDTVALGPWDEAGLRLLFTIGGRLHTVLFDPLTDSFVGAAAALEWTPVVLGDTSAPGTTSAFQVVVKPTAEATARMVRFSGGAFTLGESVPEGVLLGGTAGSRALLREAGQSVSYKSVENVWLVEDGRAGKLAVEAFAAHLSCTCDRAADVSCGCVERDTLVEVRPAPDASALSLMFADEVDGRREFFFRRLPVPFSGNPLAP
ncbi:MAG: hypothetical protein QM765_35445 [Myxococcales bacterium]